MIETVAAVLGAISALNSGIATLKEGKTNFDTIVGKWAEADEAYRNVEKSKAGAMIYKEALSMESAKRQLENFDRAFKDICLIQGQGDLYTSVKTRMMESRHQHEKEVRRIKLRKAELKKTLKLAGTVMFAWSFFMVLLFAVIWIIRQP